MEIPLGSGARELGLRPSLFIDVGSVFGVATPALTQSPLPDRAVHCRSAMRAGMPLFTEITAAGADWHRNLRGFGYGSR